MLPITGPRWVLRPHYEELITAARQVYGNHMAPVPVTRLLAEAHDPFLEKRRADKDYASFLSNRLEPTSGPVRDRHGAVCWTGHHVDVPAFLAAERRRLDGLGCRVEHRVDLEQVHIDSDRARYRDHDYRWLILCTGHRAVGVAPFSWLRYRPARGEWCELEPVEGIADGVYERRHWLHQHEGRTRCGSTYDWSNLTAGTTAAGAAELTQAAQSLVDAPVRVQRQFAGVRAPTMDRWPYAGRHPDGLRVALLAGLGSTGLLTAPYCGERLVRSLFADEPLPTWLDLARRSKDRG